MSNAIHRITGLRPSRRREVSRDGLLDTWIVRQRERGTLGLSVRGRPLVVAHTEDDEMIRIISVRPATRRERKTYEETEEQ